MVSHDAPEHRRLRELVHKGFTPRRIEEMRQTVERLVTELLDAAGKKGTADLIAGFALPLPLTVISEMIGVPEEDRLTFHRRVSGLVDIIGFTSVPRLVARFPNALGMMRFLRKLIRLRRSNPRDDLLTALVQAEERGERLSEDELVSMLFLGRCERHAGLWKGLGAAGKLAPGSPLRMMACPHRLARHPREHSTSRTLAAAHLPSPRGGQEGPALATGPTGR